MKLKMVRCCSVCFLYKCLSTIFLYYVPLKDSGSPYQPDPMQLRLSGLAGVNRGMQAPPLAPLAPPSQPAVPPHMPSVMSFGEASPTSSINVPFLSAVISSLTAEKLAAILIQNSALGPSSIVGSPGVIAQQHLQAPPISHPLLPFHIPPTSQLGSMSPGAPGDSQFSNVHRAEKYRCEWFDECCGLDSEQFQ